MPEVLDLLADAFVANKCDMQWLFRTIASTDAYQREIRAQGSFGRAPPVFAASSPKRLRADQLFNAITKVLGIAVSDSRATEALSARGRRTPTPAAPAPSSISSSDTIRRPTRTT